MDARLTINGVEVVLGHKALENVAFWLEDEPENSDIFHELAGSGSSAVRAAVAGNVHLSKETCRRLIEDTSVEVLRTITVSDKAREYMTRRDVACFIATGDCDILTVLAHDLEAFSDTFQVCEKEWLCEQLARHSDPAVRCSLAENRNTPARFLEELAEDEDLDVAGQAAKTLAQLSDDEEDDF